MKLLWTIVITAIVTFSLIAADLAGTWKGSMVTEMGDTEVTIKFQSGTALAGTATIDQYQAPIEETRLDGDKIYFEIGHGKLIFEGTVTADEMKLNVTGTQGDEHSLVCQRLR